MDSSLSVIVSRIGQVLHDCIYTIQYLQTLSSVKSYENSVLALAIGIDLMLPGPAYIMEIAIDFFLFFLPIFLTYFACSHFRITFQYRVISVTVPANL